MHLIEAYATVSGAKIDKCFIHEEPIPLPTQPYITLHSYNPKGSGRQYKYWNLVIDNLKQNLKNNYTIIQIGGKEDTQTNADISYLGKTTYNSLAYLIKHSSLHIGFDSLPVHLASHYDIKMVVLYAHYANNTKPYFSTKNNYILLEPDFSKIKPIFAQTDPFDHINSIKPEKIITSALELISK